jgi:hypothetical protein
VFFQGHLLELKLAAVSALTYDEFWGEYLRIFLLIQLLTAPSDVWRGPHLQLRGDSRPQALALPLLCVRPPVVFSPSASPFPVLLLLLDLTSPLHAHQRIPILARQRGRIPLRLACVRLFGPRAPRRELGIRAWRRACMGSTHGRGGHCRRAGRDLGRAPPPCASCAVDLEALPGKSVSSVINVLCAGVLTSYRMFLWNALGVPVSYSVS